MRLRLLYNVSVLTYIVNQSNTGEANELINYLLFCYRPGKRLHR
jgi:hypothetical protein